MPNLNEIRWIDLPSVHDKRGILTSIEAPGNIPFEIKRIFYMHHVNYDRGGHAHTDTDQLVIAISGSFGIELIDGTSNVNFRLDNPEKGLFIPRMIFINLFDFSTDSVCLVLASTHYDIKKSIRNFEEYKRIVESTLRKDK